MLGLCFAVLLIALSFEGCRALRGGFTGLTRVPGTSKQTSTWNSRMSLNLKNENAEKEESFNNLLNDLLVEARENNAKSGVDVSSPEAMQKAASELELLQEQEQEQEQEQGQGAGVNMNNNVEWDMNDEEQGIYEQYVDEKLITRLQEEVMELSGVELDQLINPGKVVNLERELIKLNAELETCGADTEREIEIKASIEKKEATLFVEKRSVMRGWLKGLFVGQSVIAVVISLFMVYDAVPGYALPLPVKVLGFWMWWLFIIPSLRARKPANAEKEALNIAFLASPIVSIALPSFTKDVSAIWWANAATMAACYGYAYWRESTVFDSGDEGQSGGLELGRKSALPESVVKAINALDYGSGKERGARK